MPRPSVCSWKSSGARTETSRHNRDPRRGLLGITRLQAKFKNGAGCPYRYDGPPRGERILMSTSLLMTRRFAPLFWCQFFSAFSDNFLKNALVFLILFKLGGDGALITLTAAVFISPYFFLSGLGGELADRNDKAWMAQRLKLAEIGISVIAVAGFALHSLVILFVALFLFGVIGSLFGPIKY